MILFQFCFVYIFRTLSAKKRKNIYKMLEKYEIDPSPLDATNQDPTLCAILP